jgi:hypothetical protein
VFDLRSLDGTALGMGATREDALRYSYPGALHVVWQDNGAATAFFGRGRWTYKAGLGGADPVAAYNRACYASQVEHLMREYLAGRLPRV